MVTTAAKWRIGLLVLIVVSLLMAVLGVLADYALHARAGTASPTGLHLIPNTDVNPFGANFFLQWEAEPFKREKTVEMAAQAGIGWAKQQFPWEDIEPAPGQYQWEKYDKVVDIYRSHGLQVIARLDRPPAWTRQDNRYPERPPDDFDDYGDFVEAFVRHFKGRVRYIQVWNEPNIFPEWGEQPVDPAAYTELLEIAYRRAKRVDPNLYVLSAPLAITLEDFPGRRNLSDLIFLEEMYEAGASGFFDILSANAFGMDRPPTDPPDAGVLNFRRVELQRDIMARHGDDDKPIWFNEYAWNAAPANFPSENLIWQRVTEEQQAQWTIEGILWAQEHWPWAGVFNIWYFRQIGNLSPDRADYYFRMVDVDFTPRRVYNAVREASQGIRVAGPGNHQETAPSVSYDSHWKPRIEPRASAEAHVVASSPGATLSFSFDGTGVDVITRGGDGAGRLAVTIDGKAVAGLTRAADGTSVLDLAGREGAWQSRLPLARNLAPGEHVLRLVALDGEPSVDGFAVVRDDAPALPWIWVGVCLVGMVVAGWLLAREMAQLTGQLLEEPF